MPAVLRSHNMRDNMRDREREIPSASVCIKYQTHARIDHLSHLYCIHWYTTEYENVWRLAIGLGHRTRSTFDRRGPSVGSIARVGLLGVPNFHCANSNIAATAMMMTMDICLEHTQISIHILYMSRIPQIPCSRARSSLPFSVVALLLLAAGAGPR